jgi:hypothetical protein
MSDATALRRTLGREGQTTQEAAMSIGIQVGSGTTTLATRIYRELRRDPSLFGVTAAEDRNRDWLFYFSTGTGVDASQFVAALLADDFDGNGAASSNLFREPADEEAVIVFEMAGMMRDRLEAIGLKTRETRHQGDRSVVVFDFGDECGQGSLTVGLES